jgi:hypothetical protein
VRRDISVKKKTHQGPYKHILCKTGDPLDKQPDPELAANIKHTHRTFAWTRYRDVAAEMVRLNRRDIKAGKSERTPFVPYSSLLRSAYENIEEAVLFLLCLVIVCDEERTKSITSGSRPGCRTHAALYVPTIIHLCSICIFFSVIPKSIMDVSPADMSLVCLTCT